MRYAALACRFAHARLASIVRKAKEEKNADVNFAAFDNYSSANVAAIRRLHYWQETPRM